MGYIWGRRNTKIDVPLKNEKERQTYYGAINVATHDMHISPFSAGNGHNTVAYIKELQAVYPQSKLLLIWDGASYHVYGEMHAYLQEINKGLDEHDWKITCELFAPNAPEQNPIEDVWLKGKQFLRKYFYKHKTFSHVKSAFFNFLQDVKFDFPKLNMYSCY